MGWGEVESSSCRGFPPATDQDQLWRAIGQCCHFCFSFSRSFNSFFSVDGDNLFFTVCLCLRHLTPVLMKGMVKSTAVCLMEVTDMSITAMSAF